MDWAGNTWVRFTLLFAFMACTLGAEETASNKWESDIRQFEQQDREAAPSPGKILFIGSSSIRKWDLRKSFPSHETLNRGFGGSQISDVLHYFDRIVVPYRPSVIVFYSGDNDIGKGKSVSTVVADYKKFSNQVEQALPETTILFLPIKPSIKRWDLWPKMNEVNQQLRAYCEQREQRIYLETPIAMLKTGSPPDRKLFEKDGLHLSDEGYRMWTELVSPHLPKQRAVGD